MEETHMKHHEIHEETTNWVGVIGPLKAAAPE